MNSKLERWHWEKLHKNLKKIAWLTRAFSVFIGRFYETVFDFSYIFHFWEKFPQFSSFYQNSFPDFHNCGKKIPLIFRFLGTKFPNFRISEKYTYLKSLFRRKLWDLLTELCNFDWSINRTRWKKFSRETHIKFGSKKRCVKHFKLLITLLIHIHASLML